MSAWAEVASGSNGSASHAQVTGLDMTAGGNADLIVIWIAWYMAGSAITAGDVTDTSGNTYTLLTSSNASDDTNVKGIWLYKIGPTVGASMTFDSVKSNDFMGMIVKGFRQGSSPTFVTQVSLTPEASGTSAQAGSIGNANDLVLTGMTRDGATTGLAVSGGLSTPTDLPYANSVNMGSAVAWLQVSGAVNPQWTWTTSRKHTAQNISFTGTGGGGGGTNWGPMLSRTWNRIVQTD